jgi:hypothetical protein
MHPIYTTVCEIMRTCMHTARSTSVRRIAAAHKVIALGFVRFGVLPYACGDCMNFLHKHEKFARETVRKTRNETIFTKII